MTNAKRLLILTVFVFGAMVASAQAQATRTWVSGVGDDANPCSRTAPCKTFAGAISKTASGGVISVLDPGGYGAVTITKAITIDGGGIEGSILSAGTTGVIISGPGAGAEVTLRNLTIFGAGTGINGIRVLGAAGGVHVEHCVISSVTTSGIDFQPSAGVLYVTNTKIIDTGVSGLLIVGRQAILDNVQIEGGNAGVRAQNLAWVSIRRSLFSGNSFAGILANSGSLVDLQESMVSHNGNGLAVTTGAEILAAGSTISSNGAGLSNDGSGFLFSLGGNMVVNTGGNVFTQTFPSQ